MSKENGIIKTFPLSPMQKSILLACSYHNAPGTYNVQVVVRLSENLDVNWLDDCWSELRKQYEHFQAALVPSEEGTYDMGIYDKSSSAIEKIDFSHLSRFERRKEWQSFVAEELQTKFDLLIPPLIRATLVKYADDHFRFVVTFHHLLFDGNSFLKVFHELFNRYDSKKNGSKYKISPCHFPKNVTTSKISRADLKYWRSIFSNYVEQGALCIYKDYPISASNPPNGRVTTTISNKLFNQIHNIARQLKITPNILFEVAWVLLLSKYTYSNDILFSSIRSIPSKKQIGLFLNTLPIRCQLNLSSQSFVDLIYAIRGQHKAFKSFHLASMEEVVRAVKVDYVNVKTALDYKPITPLSFLKKNGDTNAWENRVGYFNTDTHYDLFFEIFGGKETFSLKLNYKSALFVRIDVERLLKHFVLILDYLSSNVNKEIGALSLIEDNSSDVCNQSFRKGRSLSYPFPNLIFDFSQIVSRFPKKTAITSTSNSIDYATLNKYSSILTNSLSQQGVKPFDVVIIQMDRSINMIITLLAAIKLGATYLPVGPEVPKERLRFIIEDSHAKFIVTDDSNKHRHSVHSNIQLIDVDEVTFDGSLVNESFSSYNKDQQAYIIYTSGSTGHPKGVRIGHLALINFLVSVRDQLAITSDDVVLAVTSIGFDISGLELYLPLICGARLVVANNDDSKDPFRMKQLIDSCQITVLQATPSMWQMLLDIGWTNNGSIKVLCGGEPLSRDLALRLLSDGNGFWHCYGPTETTIWSTISYITSVDDDVTWVPFGGPILNTSLYVLDRQKKALPIGLVGEIYIAGAGLAEGYIDDVQTQERFINYPSVGGRVTRLYKTGDLACWRPDGLLEFKGRIDHQIKMRGYRIEVGDIESAIRSQKGVSACGVVPKLKNNKVQYLLAFVESREGMVNEFDIKEKLANVLPDYMIPPRIILIKKLPINANGKIDRNKLVVLADEVCSESKAKNDTIIDKLKLLYAEVLSLSNHELTLEDDFFALGGDSLSAFTLIMRIEALFKVMLSIQAIHNHSSIASLAAFIGQAHKGGAYLLPQLPPANDKVDQITPLTDFQKRLWILDKFENTGAYNVAMLIRLEGRLDIDAFRKSLSILLDRQEGLRIRIHEENNSVYQTVGEDFNFNKLFVFENSSLTDSEVEEDLSANLRKHRFNLVGDALFHIKLLRFSEETFYLVFCAHHIIFDEWSVQIFLSELSEIYNSIYLGRDIALPALKAKYLNYISQNLLWDRKSSAITGKEINFWKQYLEGFERLNLPCDFPKPPTQDFNGDLVRFNIPCDISKKVRLYAKSKKITLTNFLFSVINYLLHIYAETDDIIIGIPSTLRRLAESEHLIGPFINTVPVRVRLSNKDSFDDLTSKVQKSLIDSSSHAEFPFEKIVNALQLNIDVSENPIFQVFFTMQKNYSDYLSLSGMLASKIVNPIKKSKFNLSFYFSEHSDHIEGFIEYRKDLFKQTTVERIKRSLLLIVDQVVSKPDSLLADCSLLTSEETKIIDSWNSTDKVFLDNTVVDQMASQTNELPNHIAVEYKDQSLTYLELKKHSDSLASLLLKNGLEKESLVGVFLDKTLLLPISILGVLKAGGAYVPLEPSYPVERIKFFIESSGLTCLLCDSASYDSVRDIAAMLDRKLNILNLSTINFSENGPSDLPTLSKDNLAYVIYTSGSTGKPKGVAIEHAALNNFVCGMDMIGLSRKDRFLSVTPISFDIFGLEFFSTLTAGATLVLADNSAVLNPNELKVLICDAEITAMQATPVLWQALLDVGWQNNGSLKIVCGGEPLNRQLAIRLLSNTDGFWHCYGPTEATVWATCEYVQSLKDNPDNWISLGRPIANMKIFVLDPEGRQVPVGVKGEIYISGPGLAREYWRDPENTRKVFTEITLDNEETIRVYNTGDKGCWNEQGHLIFKGRSDQQIKLHGYRIEVGEIESYLRRHESVHEAAVTLVKDPEPYLSAFIVPTDKAVKEMDFSLFFFPADKSESEKTPYDLCFSATKYADEHGFKAVWTPERHFNQVGGQFPNPSILTAALSQITKRIDLRSGSLVLPLHNPVRVTEDWSVLDNMSGGRVGLAFASGWHPQDFVLNPEVYSQRKTYMIEGIKTIRTLWSGGFISLKDGNEVERKITIYPKPIQKTLPLWITAAENPDTFRMAGEQGAHVLTHLLGQDLGELSEKISLYRETLAKHGHDPKAKTVTLVVHTYINNSHESAIAIAKPYFTEYLKSHASLLSRFDNSLTEDVNNMSDEDLNVLIERSLNRFLETSSLVGSLDNTLGMMRKISETGVDEVACLIDFGIPKEQVMVGLELLTRLKLEFLNTRQIDVSEIRAHLVRYLPYYMVPQRFMQLDKLPKTANNKLDRATLEKIKPISSNKRHIPPETDDEKQLVRIIETLYQTDDVGLEMDLYDLGGSSLIAVQLISEIKKQFNADLTIKDIFELTNINELEKLIQKRVKKKVELLLPNDVLNPIVTLKKGDAEAPLFLIHPIGGTVYCYRSLVEHLPNDRMIYGIQDPGVLSGDQLFNTFNEMVDFYIKAIQKYTPFSDICLAGASFGGTLALEMGSQMRTQGIGCSLIGLFDTWAIFPEDLKKKFYFEANMIRQHKQMSSLLEDYNVEDPTKWLELQWHRQTLLMKYHPHTTNDLNVVLFKAAELLPEYQSVDEPSNYWSQYLSTSLSIITVSGNHETIFEEPNAGFLASKLYAALTGQILKVV